MSCCIDILENSYFSMYADFIIILCSVLGVHAVNDYCVPNEGSDYIILIGWVGWGSLYW